MPNRRPNRRQRIAIARILSDLIKSDNIIEKEEIKQYNQIIKQLEIKQDELVEAQDIRLSHAMNTLKGLEGEERQVMSNLLHKLANADAACVAREALIILSFKLMLDDTDGKYELMSCDTHGSYTNDKYVIYIESEDTPSLQDEITEEYEHITNLLRLWKYDFIYLPKVAERFRAMDEEYLRGIIHYMIPRLGQSEINYIYEKLTNVTTKDFLDLVLINDYRLNLKDTAPSLLINIGTSVVPYVQDFNNENDRQQRPTEVYTEFLKIRVDTSVLEEIQLFLSQYQNIITEPEYYRPERSRELFKYFGFYKTLFDFFTRIDFSGLIKPEIRINIRKRQIWMQGTEIGLSDTELAVYILILHQSLCTNREELPKNGRNNGITDKQNKEITAVYKKIRRALIENDNYNTTYKNDRNIRTYISRIREKIRRTLRGQFSRTYLHEEGYFVRISPQIVNVEVNGELMPFVEYAKDKFSI